MGYYTNYTVKISGFKDHDALEFFEFKEFYKEGGLLSDFKSSTNLHIISDLTIEFELSQYKWYNWQKDLEALSKKYPNLLIEVDGVGEEFPDVWKARIRNNVTEVVEAKIVFPDFKKIC